MLEDEAEVAVAKKLAEWPRLVEIAARTHEPHRIAFYLYDLASDFHALWNKGNENSRIALPARGRRAASAQKIALATGRWRCYFSRSWYSGGDPGRGNALTNKRDLGPDRGHEQARDPGKRKQSPGSEAEMADMYLGDSAGRVDGPGPGALTVLFNWLGALMSMALIVGLAVWGYQLMMRDVTGVPVVRALEGPMRVAPDDPGGERAAHQGLAVNSVAADGAAEAPADRLILAPKPLDLRDEDLPRGAAGRGPMPATASETGAETDVLALADDLATNVTPLSAVIAAPTVAGLVPATVPGVARSPLPRARPIGDLTAEAVAERVALSVSGPAVEVDPASLPVGTRLVQFGAYDSAEAARAEWVKLDGRFTDFLTDKKRVIEKAVSGGKTFYRLRAVGFADINDARRFCSALLAEKQACIPVVTR